MIPTALLKYHHININSLPSFLTYFCHVYLTATYPRSFPPNTNPILYTYDPYHLVQTPPPPPHQQPCVTFPPSFLPLAYPTTTHPFTEPPLYHQPRSVLLCPPTTAAASQKRHIHAGSRTLTFSELRHGVVPLQWQGERRCKKGRQDPSIPPLFFLLSRRVCSLGVMCRVRLSGLGGEGWMSGPLWLA